MGAALRGLVALLQNQLGEASRVRAQRGHTAGPPIATATAAAAAIKCLLHLEFLKLFNDDVGSSLNVFDPGKIVDSVRPPGHSAKAWK